MKYLGLPILIFCLCANSHGKDSKGKYATLGQGINSCGKVTKIFKSSDEVAKQLTQAWVNGYITALNISNQNTYNISDGVDLAGRTQWILNYCKNNPLNQLSNAVEHLAHELETR